jgi:hypothetical protein
LHVLEDSAIYSSLQQYNSAKVKGNNGHRRKQKIFLQYSIILFICAAFFLSIYLLHDVVTSLEKEQLGDGNLCSHSQSSVVKDTGVNNKKKYNDSELQIDKGMLFDFHGTNVSGETG